MAMQAMSGMGPRAMAGKGAMQQQEVQTQARTQARTQTQAQAKTSTGTPEMASGTVMNMTEAGSTQQSAGQNVGANFGGAEVQFSERSGVGFGAKG